TVVIDSTAPVVTLANVNGTPRTFPLSINASVTTLSGACGGAPSDSPTVSITITGAATQNSTAPCTAGAWTYTTSPALTAQGVYSVTVNQTDAANNTGTTGVKSITIDTVAPNVTLTSVNGTARTFPFNTNVAVTSVGGACGNAAGDNAVAISITGSSTQN